MSVDTRLGRAVSDLETAFTPAPPPLPEKSGRPAALTTAFIAAAVLVAGVVWLSAQRQGEGLSGDVDAVAPTETDAVANTRDSAIGNTTPPTSTSPTSTPPTSTPPTSTPPPTTASSAVEAADRLFALASPPPPGFLFDRGTSVADSPAENNLPCADCISLEIRRSTWLPLGPQDLITVSLHRSLYRNPAGAEELTLRGRDATIDADSWQQTLVWDETPGLTVVVTANGFERGEAVAVAEALSIDAESLAVEAVFVPEASVAVSAEDFASPKLLLQYRSDDDAAVTVQVYEAELDLTSDRRADLRSAVDAAGLTDHLQQVRYLERDGGVGVFFIGHDQSVVQFWTAEGLVLHLQGDEEKVGEQALTDLAASFMTVTATAWEAAGGQ